MHPLVAEFQEKEKKLAEIQKKADSAIIRWKKRVSKQEAQCHWVSNLCEDIAQSLTELTGYKHELMGPFGLNAVVHFRLYVTDDHDGPMYTLDVASEFNEDHTTKLLYRTDERLTVYPQGSIGWLNNLGYRYAELPDTTEKIFKLMHYVDLRKLSKEAQDNT